MRIRPPSKRQGLDQIRPHVAISSPDMPVQHMTIKVVTMAITVDQR